MNRPISPNSGRTPQVQTSKSKSNQTTSPQHRNGKPYNINPAAHQPNSVRSSYDDSLDMPINHDKQHQLLEQLKVISSSKTKRANK